MNDVRCIGMCSKEITCVLEDEDEVHRRWVLFDVVVLESLPVPLHVSAKAGVSVQVSRPSISFEAWALPPKYRSHPFWTRGDIFIGTLEGMEELVSFLKQNTRPPIEGKCCAMCGGTAQLLKCGKCRILRYCSKDHQVSHWTKHKMRCKAPESGSSSSGSAS